MGTVSARGRGNESYHPVMATLLSGNVAAIARISEYAAEARATAAQSSKGSFIRMVSSRSGEVLSSATGAPISSSTRRTYRSEEHTSELQSLMRISYAVFCLKKKNHNNHNRIYKT